MSDHKEMLRNAIDKLFLSAIANGKTPDEAMLLARRGISNLRRLYIIEDISDADGFEWLDDVNNAGILSVNVAIPDHLPEHEDGWIDEFTMTIEIGQEHAPNFSIAAGSMYWPIRNAIKKNPAAAVFLKSLIDEAEKDVKEP